jgi:AcrR family transcriptional regulator
MGEGLETAKENQRVRLTKTLLREAFLLQLAEKPVQSVTVKALCEAAGVNRGTFYLHYRDVRALLEALEKEMLADLDELLGSTPVIVDDASPQASAGFIAALFNFFQKNRGLCAVLLGSNGDKKFVAAIIERGRKKAVGEYRALFPKVGRQQAEVFYSFIAWGFIGLVQQSLKGEQGISFEKAAAYAERIVARAAGFFAEESGAEGGESPNGGESPVPPILKYRRVWFILSHPNKYMCA